MDRNFHITYARDNINKTRSKLRSASECSQMRYARIYICVDTCAVGDDTIPNHFVTKSRFRRCDVRTIDRIRVSQTGERRRIAKTTAYLYTVSISSYPIPSHPVSLLPAAYSRLSATTLRACSKIRCTAYNSVTESGSARVIRCEYLQRKFPHRFTRLYIPRAL